MGSLAKLHCDGEEKEHSLDTSACLTKVKEWMGGGQGGRGEEQRCWDREGRATVEGWGRWEGAAAHRGGEEMGGEQGRRERSGEDVEFPDPVGQAPYDDLMKERRCR